MHLAGVYRLLLRLYPASFRAEYGGEMEAIFAARRREAGTWPAVAALLTTACVEETRNAAAAHWDILRQDLRYTARALRRSPGFAATAVLLVCLGIGANTAVFSVADFVLLRPLPYPAADRLVKVWETSPGYSRMEASPGNYRDWKRMTRAFEQLAAFTTRSFDLVGQGDPQRLVGAMVTADLLPALRARPRAGRVFEPADDVDGAPGTLLLSYRLWQAAFGGDPGVVGRPVILDSRPYKVIGIMPREFQFPDRGVDLWVAAQLPESAYVDRTDNWLEVLGRLEDGATIEQARAEMDVAAARLRQQFPKENENTGARVIGLRDELSQQSRLLLAALCWAALCVLLIACANLANLLLARALGRRQELAVRTAVGAGRERLARQLGTESLVLAIAGGVLGVGVAAVAVPLLARLVPDTLPVAEVPSVDLRVLLFASVLTALAGIVFGLAPVLRTAGQVDLSGLREGARAGGGRKERLRAALVVVEVAASVVLLVAAGLLARALWRVQATDPGFRTEGVLTLGTSLPLPKYEKVASRTAFYDHVLSDIRALPGVTQAAYIGGLPMVRRGGIWPVAVTGEPESVRADGKTASLRFVTPGFFAALGIPIRLGRDVSDADTRDRPFVAVVSESFVRRHWPGLDPIGRRFNFALSDREVVGVVRDIRVRGLERSSEPQVYVPSRQVDDGSLIGYTPGDLVVRASVSPATLLPAIRRIVREADPEQPISNVRTLDDIVAEQTGSRSVQLRVIAGFAALAFLLAAVGIHALLSFAVSQRSQEIGVRMVLGATPRDILSIVLGRAAVLAAVGIVPGVGLAYAAGRAMSALLAGVTPGDPPAFLVAVALAVVMTLAGCLAPTLRAVRVDPIRSIRAE